MSSSVSHFAVTFDKPGYFAGETVRATVHLTTSAPIKCRGVRADVRGEGYCHFVTGSGDNREHRTHHAKYWRETHTLWGPSHRTEEIDEAGENAIWGSPWAPNEGVLHIPFEFKSSLIVRVLDEDYGKKDDLLGEVLIPDADRLVADCQNGAADVTLPLLRKGKPESKNGGASELTLTAMFIEHNGMKTVRLVCKRALNLRSGDWFGKNDVYVQAYWAPDSPDIDASKALPEPDRQVELPAGEYTFELPVLMLPDCLPASREGRGAGGLRHGLYHHVRYFVEAKIDIAWWKDPFVRGAFTVAPRLCSASIPPQLASAPMVEKKVYEQCCCCEATWNDPLGDIQLEVASIDRLHGAPGELISLSASACNKSKAGVDLVVKLEVHVKAWAENFARMDGATAEMLRLPVPQGDAPMQVMQQLRIPHLPASYHGGFLVNNAWKKTIEAYGMRDETKYWRSRRTDPVTWWYQLVIELDVHGNDFDLSTSFPFIVTSIPAPPPVAQIILPFVPAVPLPMVGTALGEAGAVNGWYSQQMPLSTMSAAPLELVTNPQAVNMSAPHVQFVPATTPVNMGLDHGREKGVVVGDDSYTPCYPVVVQAVPMPDGAGVPAVVAQVVPVQAAVPEGETMARV